MQLRKESCKEGAVSLIEEPEQAKASRELLERLQKASRVVLAM